MTRSKTTSRNLVTTPLFKYVVKSHIHYHPFLHYGFPNLNVCRIKDTGLYHILNASQPYC